MATGEWSLAAVHDVVAAAVPDREMLVWATRRTYGEVASAPGGSPRSSRAGASARAASARARALGVRPGPVALLLYNCPEYIEAMLGCFRARAVPFNVNQHYRPEEVARLLDMLGAEAVVYHRALGRCWPRRRRRATVVLVDVDDGSGVAPLAGQHRLRGGDRQTPLRRRSRSRRPTTSTSCAREARPARRRACSGARRDIFVAAMGGIDGASAESIAAGPRPAPGLWFAAPPLMHAAAQWTAFCGAPLRRDARPPRRPGRSTRARSSRRSPRARDLHVDRRRRLRAAA